MLDVDVNLVEVYKYLSVYEKSYLYPITKVFKLQLLTKWYDSISVC